MNVLSTLKTVFFGSKFLSTPVSSDGTPRRDLESALNGLMPLCRTIPGVRPAPDIREGRVVLALDRTPRTDGNAPAGSYHYIVSGVDGVKEVTESQVLTVGEVFPAEKVFLAGNVLPAGNDGDNLTENTDDLPKRQSVSGEKTKEDSARMKGVREKTKSASQTFLTSPSYPESPTSPESSSSPSSQAFPTSSSSPLSPATQAFLTSSSSPTSQTSQTSPASPTSPVSQVFPSSPELPAFLSSAASSEEAGKKTKSYSLMREVTAFLTSRYRFRFNLITEETEVAVAENDVPDAHLRYAKADERWMNSLSLEAIEAGIDCWDRDIQRFVRSRRIGEYHPFTAYFGQLPGWDGTDRVSAPARRVSDDPVWVNGFHRWMPGLSAQWMQIDPDNRRANSVAPLLVSGRQGLGKSTFCRLLMPDALKPYYTESYDLGSPASAEAKLAAYGLINPDEFDKLGASKMPLLKNLMQASAPNVRRAYKRSASALPRIASFIGTSNREDLPADRTGSRRFLCVNLEHAIDCTSPVDHEQLYAQLKAELLSGERSWFDKEEEQAIQQHNSLFYKHIPEEEVFRLCFRFATEEDSPREVQTLSAVQLFERMKAARPAAMRGMTAYGLSRILPQLGERIHTARGNVYRVVAVV